MPLALHANCKVIHSGAERDATRHCHAPSCHSSRTLRSDCFHAMFKDVRTLRFWNCLGIPLAKMVERGAASASERLGTSRIMAVRSPQSSVSSKSMAVSKSGPGFQAARACGKRRNATCAHLAECLYHRRSSNWRLLERLSRPDHSIPGALGHPADHRMIMLQAPKWRMIASSCALFARYIAYLAILTT